MDVESDLSMDVESDLTMDVESDLTMDVESQVEYYSIVPKEIFVLIFRSLPLEDRKNLRLTCRCFYELCDAPIIRASEVIVRNGDLNNASELPCLSRYSRNIQNIKLNRTHIRTEAIFPFFEQQGANVQSIVFEDCFFDAGALKCVIERCVNLRNFTLKFTWFFNNSITNVLNDFEQLETELIIRKSVTSLRLIFLCDTSGFSNRKFLRFFMIFPQVTKLTFIIQVKEIYEDNKWTMLPADLTSDRWFTCSCIYDCLLVLADQLEALKLGVDCYPFDTIELTKNILNIRMKNLKELSLNWDGIPAYIFEMRNSLLFQQLTRFNCSMKRTNMISTPPEKVASLMQHLLTYSYLRRLRITGSYIPMNLELFQHLAKSELEFLQIDRIRGDASPVLLLMNSDFSSSANTLKPNYKLQYLFIHERDKVWDLIFAFYFRSVKYLQLTRVHPDNLENILKHRLKIHALRLNTDADRGSLEDASYYQPWLKEDIVVNSEFKYLVELRIDEKKYSQTSILLGKFEFPTLKTLHVLFRSLSEDNEKEFWQLIRKLPKLECLDVRMPCCRTDLAQDLVGLSRLRHCHIVCTSTKEYPSFSLSESDYIQMFDIIPSLRTFVHRDDTNYGLNGFFYDAISKTVVNVRKGDYIENYNIQFCNWSALDRDVIDEESRLFVYDLVNYHYSFLLALRLYVPIVVHRTKLPCRTPPQPSFINSLPWWQ